MTKTTKMRQKSQHVSWGDTEIFKVVITPFQDITSSLKLLLSTSSTAFIYVFTNTGWFIYLFNLLVMVLSNLFIC